MPRKSPTYANSAARAFLRGTAHTSPHEAIQAGARTQAEWTAFLEGREIRFWARNGLKARKAVKNRHPMQLEAVS